MKDYGIKILLENVKGFSERNELMALSEADLSNVNNVMITNLYKTIIDKSHIDFGDIPNTKGDITKYSGYKGMENALSILREISQKSNMKMEEIDVVSDAISFITLRKELFEKGFKLEKEFIILQYNSLVMACVESVSVLISSYVDYVKRPDKIDFKIIQNPQKSGWICIQNLQKFNLSVKNGDFDRVLNTSINSGSKGFIGLDDVALGVAVIGGIALLIPIIREIIFYFYYSRMKTSEYLRQQADFLELNKLSVQNNPSISPQKKSAIIKAQEEKIKSLLDLSEKIKVNNVLSGKKTVSEITGQNKGWNFKDMPTVKSGQTENRPAFSIL